MSSTICERIGAVQSGRWICRRRSAGYGGRIDGHVHELPAASSIAKAAVAVDAVTDRADTAQRLHIEVNELPGMLALIAQRWGIGSFEQTEARESDPAQHRGDGGARHAQALRDLPPGQPLAAQLHDLADPFLGCRLTQSLRPRRTIGQSGIAFDSMASEPLADCGFAQVVGSGDHRDRPPLLSPQHHRSSTHRGRLGVTMNSHSGSSSGALESSTTPFSMRIPGDSQPQT